MLKQNLVHKIGCNNFDTNDCPIHIEILMHVSITSKSCTFVTNMEIRIYHLKMIILDFSWNFEMSF